MLIPTASRVLSLAQSLSVLLVPHGGQHTARRNAWAALAGEASLTRDRREADAAVAAAQLRHALLSRTAAGR